MLSDPYEKIIKSGGLVLFARIKNRIVGTCALIKHDGNRYELAKLAVAKDFRQRYVGTRLASALIDRASEVGVKTLILETSPRFPRAISFFERMGFRISKSCSLPRRYRRRRVTMEKDLTVRADFEETRRI